MVNLPAASRLVDTDAERIDRKGFYRNYSSCAELDTNSSVFVISGKGNNLLAHLSKGKLNFKDMEY